ncbi:nuclear transport factor 2 family protein [Nocardioides sp.]|uniref:nuclear transport factor 2 family protein n=1 Tax=Nocardioides sp. TaxID=35761 RepID=UPI00378494D3
MTTEHPIQDLAGLTRRLAKLEAVEEIRALKLRYGRLCDSGYPTDEILQMFTDDATWDGGETFGVFRGLDEIRRFFVSINEEVGFAVHFMIGDSITIGEDLDTAAGTWHMLEAATMEVDGGLHPMWLMAVYSDRYRRVDGQWKFSAVRLDFRMQARHDLGWGERLLQLQ